MANASRDPILLTPGPLTTALSTKIAMLRDWGSRADHFIAVNARVRERLLTAVNGDPTHVCVPIQGSGTFAVEAAVNTLVPRDGHLLVLVNGAYGHRLARLSKMMGRRVSVHEISEGAQIRPAEVAKVLAADTSITDVAVIHCETSTGVLNPLHEIAGEVARHGRRLIVDAMSSFAAIAIDAKASPFDALVASSGKCVEGPPGVGFVFLKKSTLDGCAGNCTSLSLDLHDQWQNMEKTAQWRFTPPTHVVMALDAALQSLEAEGGQRARLARYTRNFEVLVCGMGELGFRPYLPPSIQAPIIVTFHAPADPRYSFQDFYDRMSEKGFVLYPGKLTKVETFRVGCIGAIGPDEVRSAVNAMRDTLAEMGIRDGAPKIEQAA